jgi:hypothetical protein
VTIIELKPRPKKVKPYKITFSPNALREIENSRKCRRCPHLEVLTYDQAKFFVCKLREEEIVPAKFCENERL